MGSMEDTCVVCAEPLLFAGLGPCGHKEVCARCVARMRFVLKDNRCVLCQQESPHVYFTRYLGDYTQRVSADFFSTLKDKAATGEVYELPLVNGFFDDQRNYLEIKKLCSYTHPILPAHEPHEFQTLQQLKSNVEKRFSREFCSICLKSRKVFICEQLVYTKKELERHMKTGDETGALAESGFKGHPLCRFCRTRYYGVEDLYKHMEASHEHCFICRRVAPDKFIYYRHYEELEEHFKKDHHLCPHPSCLEQKFVVFVSEAELKRHFAQEHGDELKMSRAQRREALTLQLQFQYNRPGGQQDGHDHASYNDRPGVVIGGGSQVGSRVARRGRNGRQEPGLAAAVQASMETLATDAERRTEPEGDNPSSVTFSASDFPSVSNATSGVTGIGTAGRWAGGQAGPSGSLNPEEFPSLPSMSRADKRRAKKEEQARKTLAERLNQASQQPRVLHRAVEGVPPQLQASDFPSLHTASTSRAFTPPAGRAHPTPPPVQARLPPDPTETSRPPGPPPPSTDSHATPSAASVASGTNPAPGLPRTRSGTNIRNLEEFPTLVSTSKKKGKPKAVEKVEDGAKQAAAAAPAGGVSDSLKAANKALIEKVKKTLSDTQFAEFRKRSGDFMRRQVSAQQYHDIIVELGLLSLAADMVALCPEPELRAQLMAAHKEYLEVIAEAEQAGLPPTNGWMPIEAALAAASEAESNASWSCPACTLINAPGASHCEVCGLRKPKPGAASPFTAAAAASVSATSSSAARPPPVIAWQGPEASSSNGTQTRPAVVEDFPALTPAGSSSNSDKSGTAGPRVEAAVPEPSASAGAEKKKKKGKQATSLGTFLQEKKPAPAGWGNANAAASIKANVGAAGSGAGGADSSVRMSTVVGRNAGATGGQPSGLGAPAAPPVRGQWARNGGSKLAKQIGAINDAWGRS